MTRLWPVLGLMFVMLGPAMAQMPDPRMMAGQSVPDGSLPAGAVTVRVVREQLANNVPGVAVELHGAGAVRTAVTGEDGRAAFSGLPIGSRVRAVARVGDEQLETIQFEVPAAGGMRTLLVAGIGVGTPGAAGSDTPAAPAPSGSPDALGLGNNSRFAVEFQDDTPTFFYLLEIVNRSSAPVALDSALVFDMPVGAVGTTVLEGATPMASARGERVTVSGPFPPGVTPLPMAFRLEASGSTLSLTQQFPLPLDQVALAVQRVGELKVSSPQAPQVREASLRGTAFLIAGGPPLPAGTPLQITLSGLPHHSPLPLYVALAVSIVIAGWAIWLSTTDRQADGRRRRQLETRRERGLAALAALEAERGAGRVSDADYAARRNTLLQQLERIYGELDVEGTLPGGGQGLAA